MKIRELEKIVNNLGLECEWGNNMQVIMTIWQPHKNSGYNIGGKYYSADTLGEKQVKELNNKFEKLLITLKKNKIKVKEVDTIENGVISQITLMVRFERLTNIENDTLNFEIEDFEDWSGGRWIDYDEFMPEEIGYGAGFYEFNVSEMFRNFELKKHERDMVIENIGEIFKRFVKDENLEWIMNFIRLNGDVRPLQIALENGVLTPKETIEELFGNDEIYYDAQLSYTKILKLLTPFKVDELNINKNSNYRGYLPEIITTSPKLYKQVLENWEFEYDSGQRILTFLIQDEYYKQFKQFMNVKDPKKYYFDDWYDLQEYFLKTIGADDYKLVKQAFVDGWLDMEHIDYNYILDFMYADLNHISPQTASIIVEEYMKQHQKIPLQEFMLERLFQRMEEDGLHDSFVSKPVMETFIKYVVDGVSFLYGDGAIMIYLVDDHPLKIKLLQDSDFINYLLKSGKDEYLPTTIKDLFIF